jgi:flagellar biosynthesis chaperone FliJ
MPKFVFPYEAVLTKRRADERARQLAVASIERERIAIEDTIRACQRGIETEREELRRALKGEQSGERVNLPDARRQAGATLHLVARAQREVHRLAGVASRLDAARLELLAAVRGRRAMELTRERMFEEWKAEQSRREAAALDELAVMRAGGTIARAAMMEGRATSETAAPFETPSEALSEIQA